MTKFVTSKLVHLLLIGCMCSAASSLQAIARDDGGQNNGGDDKSTIKVTESEANAKLVGAGTQTAAKGGAESSTVTKTDTATNTTTTNATLSISVRKLTLADGSVVTFALNGATIGTANVKKGRTSLRLSTKKGTKVPTISAGDTITVIDSDGTTVDLKGAFGPVSTQTE